MVGHRKGSCYGAKRIIGPEYCPALRSCSRSRTDLKVAMRYRLPDQESRDGIEAHPVAGRKATPATQSVGLDASAIPTLLVEYHNRAPWDTLLAKAIADGIPNPGPSWRRSSVEGFRVRLASERWRCCPGCSCARRHCETMP